MKNYGIFSILFLLFSLVGVLYLVKNNQDIRDRAAGEYNGGSLCGGYINNWCSQNGVTATLSKCPNQWQSSCWNDKTIKGTSLCLEKNYCGSQQLDIYYPTGGSCWVDYWDYSCDTPTATPRPPTNTPVPPTNTPKVPTATPTKIPPTATPTKFPPTATPTKIPPTATPTKIPPTATPTKIPPTATGTPKPTNTPTPTNTPAPTATGTPKPTNTPTPTNTPAPTATGTPQPTATNTPIPPTNTPLPTQVIAQGPSPTRIILLESGIEFPSQILTIFGGIITLLGFLILL